MAEDSYLSHEEQVNLLKTLHRLTLGGKIEWSRPPNALRSDRRIARTPDGKFAFSVQSVDRDSEPPYELSIYRFTSPTSSVELASIAMEPRDEGGNDEINSLVAELYEKAHQRQASEEKIVKELFNTLNQTERDESDT